MRLTRLPERHALEYVTPSGAAALAECPLRVAYNQDPALRRQVPSSPAARLGDICHAVLEAAGRGRLKYSPKRAEWKAAFDEAWAAALDRELKRSRQNAAEAHWPAPERWPNYAVRKLAARRLCAEVASASSERADMASSGRAEGDVFEASQDAFDGRLRGRADVIRRHPQPEIEDYKTGSVFEEDSDEVKPQYRLQMLLYAVLEHESGGEWPAYATLVPLEGERASIVVDPSEALALAHDALRRLERFNEAVQRGDPLDGFARASAQTCRFCGFAVVCPGFWTTATPDWAEQGVVAVCGEREEVRESQVGTFSVEVAVHSGTVPPGGYTLAQLDSARFESVRLAARGSQVAAVFLRGDAADGAFRATQRTRMIAG